TDVIVGFPGETEDEFDETYRFIERVGFYELHGFRYSKRTGTPAASMPGQLTEREKAHRSQILIELGDRLAADYRRAHIGRHTTVLTEEYKTIGGVRYLTGHTPEYICVGIRDGAQGTNRLVSGIYGDPADAEILTFLPDTDAVK
ncbi:MAG: tRNA (N(6)-L-threonylcarbamoyladenosine(37)-C(2))-methylthiotransferase MtaB, partial [Oscillospiraceae bacterium]|nr:tRNA (N(6)-L-threonylcarbamoyladenosine(37)-C(2))-methylthiotransferase MtaB [Oscillospiraceae bacterium]